jgi:hypothetical protein
MKSNLYSAGLAFSVFFVLAGCGGTDPGCVSPAVSYPGLLLEVRDVANVPLGQANVSYRINGGPVVQADPGSSIGIFSLGAESDLGFYSVTATLSGYQTKTETFDVKASTDCAQPRPRYRMVLNPS